mmetsp:Transcript_9013/g.25121  ORF Transcript_9013/g.25121 Transcript_9013/m.25121 type:complete len:588 (-) Transcript_9013:216-1979(-)|eukprot:CAMPEP_0179065928 /NCGR_PEP_ID=MMETSP0796-20121207/28717_1 /TAXON_ID=73915 /ORGANISM="Pyrodinium bahamense, Strain pbaha01" /LENGTH=587 /DNA_ID=CAMNT_0020762923 /DNA_START=87 /DNA_END=1850 /DNA_ORIENTATION=-
MAKRGDAASCGSSSWIFVEAAEIAEDSESLIAPEPALESAQAVARPAADAEQLRMSVRPLTSSVAIAESEALGMVSLRMPCLGEHPRVPSLDVVALVDRSGSMCGERLHLVKCALQFISKQLRPHDRLAVISYASDVSLDLPLTRMDVPGQEACAKSLAQLTARGQTNLGGGLLQGLGPRPRHFCCSRMALRTRVAPTQTSTALSDTGHRSRVIYCFGFGADHNARTLFSLADASTGCYYYVDKPSAIAPSFADCHGGLFSLVAQDVTLTLRPMSGAQLRNVHADFTVENEGEATQLRMRDLAAGAGKDVLFSLTLPELANPSSKWPALQCIVQYIDVLDGRAREQQHELVLNRSSENLGDLDLAVEAHRCRLIVVKALDEAAALCAAGKNGVGELLTEAQDTLERSRALAKSSPVRGTLEVLLEDLQLCRSHITDAKVSEKWCSSRAFAHKHQVSTRAEGLVYRNALQERMVAAARVELSTCPVPEAFSFADAGRTKHRRQPALLASTSIGSVAAGDEIAAGVVRVGTTIVCPRSGKPGKVQQLTTSKTGKHGHAKVFLKVLCSDGVSRESVVPASDSVKLPASVM